MKSKAVSVVIQILVWAGLLLLPRIFSPPTPPGFAESKNADFAEITIKFLFLIGFYYLNYYLLIPRFFLKKETTKYILSVIGSFAVFLFISHILNDSFDVHPMNDFKPKPPEFGPSTIFFVVFLFVSLGLRMNFEWKRTEEEKIKIEKEKLNAELSYLKGQVNPHFLFNTLNIIYTLATQRSDKTAEAVMKLSKLMRYVITNAQTPFVPLEMEIGYIENLIELHRLRLATNNQIHFSVTGSSEGLEISPFILIPFVENAIKHGTSTVAPMKIDIEIVISKNQIHFSVLNNKLNTSEKNSDSTGVGNENTRKRLEMIYKKNHTLQINETEETFEVVLNIFLS